MSFHYYDRTILFIILYSFSKIKLSERNRKFLLLQHWGRALFGISSSETKPLYYNGINQYIVRHRSQLISRKTERHTKQVHTFSPNSNISQDRTTCIHTVPNILIFRKTERHYIPFPKFQYFVLNFLRQNEIHTVPNIHYCLSSIDYIIFFIFSRSTIMWDLTI